MGYRDRWAGAVGALLCAAVVLAAPLARAAEGTLPSPGIREALRDGLPGDGDEVLAETVGLLMHYAWLTGDRPLFEAQVAQVEGVLASECGLLSWRATADGAATASASVDDLKVVRALFLGAQRWAEPRWDRLGHELAASVLEHETVDGQLVDAASWSGGHVSASDTLQTAYLDLGTLAMLAPRDPAWAAVYARSLEVLRAAETEHGLFVEQVARGGRPVRAAGAEVNAIHVLYCALHLAEMGEGGRRTLDHLHEAYEREGRLPGRYRLADGEPVPGYENRAVYALTARLALELGDEDTARRLLEHLVRWHLLDPVIDPAARAEVGFAALAFDNLQTLISLERQAQQGAPRPGTSGGS